MVVFTGPLHCVKNKKPFFIVKARTYIGEASVWKIMLIISGFFIQSARC